MFESAKLRRAGRTASAGAVLLLAVAAQALADPAAPVIPNGHAHVVRSCEPQPGEAVGCHALVVGDDHGRPLRFERHADEAVAPMAAAGATAYAPGAIHTAYRLGWYSPVRQTIAVVIAYHHPYAKHDLDYYDSSYGLGSFPWCSATVTTACFDQVNQNGYRSGYPSLAPSTSTWDLEASMDIETAHMLCLNCKVLLVEAPNDWASLAAAENTAARFGATEISNSWGSSESSAGGGWPYRSAFNHPGVAITFSAGDGNYGAQFPADLNTVVAVGGTNLYTYSDGTYYSETVWGLSSNGGTGSGCSSFSDSYTNAPYWQTSVANWGYTGCGSRRAIADVAADASCDTASWVFTTNSTTAYASWELGCGTSLAAPIIAGVYALAGDAASTSWPGQLPYLRSGYLHDVTSGANGYCGTIMCQGTRGYDGPTGLGTPYGATAF